MPAGAVASPQTVCRVVRLQRYASPCGDLILGELDGRLCLCDWDVRRDAPAVRRRLQRRLGAGFAEADAELLRLAARQLDEYFAGRRRSFTPALLTAGTDFQQAVWRALAAIPYGRTTSYARLAQTLGRPSAVRAVAAAVGANALSLFLPCHRITGADRSLTGYAGGLAAKRFLLELERQSEM